ncbi:MAG: hypothetical protein WD555_01615 [Fulvivirga sp.]
MRIKKNLYTLFYTCILVMANIAVTNAQNTHSKAHLKITPDKAITETKKGVELIDGKCLLIEIKITTGGDPRIDKQVITTLTFTIPENTGHFEFSNFKKHEAYLVISGCRCIDLGYNPVVSGFIKGKLQKDGCWHISADVVATGRDSGEKRHFKY